MQVDEQPALIPSAQLISQLVSGVRNHLFRALDLIERLCLSSRRNDWFAATMSVSITSCAAIVFIDTMIAIPSPILVFVPSFVLLNGLQSMYNVMVAKYLGMR